MRRDHAMVSGGLVRQRSRARSLEEDGSHLCRRLVDAQRATRDVAGVVDERLNRHLPAILEAAQMVRDRRISQPTMEQALRGWVLERYGPSSMADPKFREIFATLVRAAVLGVESPPSLEALSWRLLITAQPVLRFPTKAVGRGPRHGASTVSQPSGPGHVPGDVQVATPSAATPGHHHGDGAAGRTSGGDGASSVPDQATATTTTPGREGLRSLLVHLNKVPQEGQSEEAHKLHFYLATKSDLPPEFAQSNLQRQYTALGKLLPSRPQTGPASRAVRPGAPAGASHPSRPSAPRA